MSTGVGHTHHHEPLHERVERALGADIRLIYGIGVPMIGVLGFVIALAISGQGWMVGAVVVFLLIALAVVVFGLYEMLGEDSDDEQTRSTS
jgi:cell shape-determining protein MreD